MDKVPKIERYKILGGIAAGIVYTALAGFVGYTIGQKRMEEACQRNLEIERTTSLSVLRDFRTCVRNCGGDRGFLEEFKMMEKSLKDLLPQEQK